KDAALVAFVSPNTKDWRFSLVKMEYQLEQTAQGQLQARTKLTPAKRFSFLVGKNENSYTAKKQFLPILTNDQSPLLSEFDEAFNVEKVTKEFFAKYRDLFIRVKEELETLIIKDKKISQDFKEKNIDPVDFSKKLLGQIVFLYFLQKKGWFGVKKDEDWGTGSKNFLRELFETKHKQYKYFFNEVLEPLFYEALRYDRSHDDHYFSQFNCKIPFLDGGLFDPINEYDWIKTDILLPNTLFSNERPTKEGDKGDGILDIFDRYNFTIKEDEPLEKEVAIDPEMLGKVFENLLEVKDRKSKGSYYTPREIVHYMCQQSLINYLDTELKSKSNQQDIETLIKFGDSTIEHDKNIAEKNNSEKGYKLPKLIIKQAQDIDDLLADIRVCDPAVGSGAFLVGMMNEIIKARNALTSHLKNQVNRSIYHFKRQAIEKSLYGVDIDLGAVEIAKLRLWLSLIVDEENINVIKPLPNLDYKIMQGNSLIEYVSPESLAATNDPERTALIRNFNQAKDKYQTTYDPAEKKNKREEINSLIENIMLYDEKRKLETDKTWQKVQQLKQNNLFGEDNEQMALGKLSENEIKKVKEQQEKFNQLKQASPQDHFEWHLNFNEIFKNKGGFDVIIANPPYVRVQNLSYEEIDKYKKRFQTAFKRIDISILFMELANQIMNKKSIASYITSSQFLKTEYGRKIREFLKTKLKIIIFFGDNQIFADAINYTSIFLFAKKNKNNYFKITNTEKYLGKQSFDSYIKNHSKKIYKKSLSSDSWNIEHPESFKILNKIHSSSNDLLKTIASINYGLVTGKDKVLVFKKKEKEFLEKSQYVYPLLKPLNIGKYFIENPNHYVIYPYEIKKNKTILVNEDKLNNKANQLYKYLFENKSKLINRKDSRKIVKEDSKTWYSLMRHSSFQKVNKEKIVTQALCKKNEFCLDQKGLFFTGGSIYSINSTNLKISNKALLGLLNSKICEFFYQLTCPIRQHGYKFYAGNFLKQFPIAKKFKTENKKLSNLVTKINQIAHSNADNSEKGLTIKIYEKQIDQIVYKLYNLTPEEIQIVKKGI
ncbi:MAG: DNA methyltransferase, partial [Candidatus Beckwithbacteria bacterium]